MVLNMYTIMGLYRFGRTVAESWNLTSELAVHSKKL